MNFFVPDIIRSFASGITSGAMSAATAATGRWWRSRRQQQDPLKSANAQFFFGLALGGLLLWACRE